MRIALFSSTADVKNGYGNITAEYCRALTQAGIEFTLFLPEAERGFHAKYIPEVQAEFTLPPYIFEMKNPKSLLYFKTIDVSSYDIVHSLLDFPYCFVAARSAKKYKKPFMMGSQGTYGVVPLLRFPDRVAMEWTYAQAKHIVVPSQFTKNIILKHTKKQYPIDIIHNGVNFARFETVPDVSGIRAQYPGKTIFLTVGGLKQRKGQDLVFEALVELKKSYTDFVYLLVGAGEWGSVLEAKAKELGVSEHVHFLGAKDGSELVRYFHACDVYVHTPKVVHFNFEGFGIVYLEAGACGKPSIATDAGGVADAVVDGKTGFIVPDGDTKAIADRLLKVSKDTALRTRMGEEGKKYAKEHDWSLVVRRFVDLYLSITSKRVIDN
jgi:phosphatidylinositol alpha-1,6-mannosyltransferase